MADATSQRNDGCPRTHGVPGFLLALALVGFALAGCAAPPDGPPVPPTGTSDPHLPPVPSGDPSGVPSGDPSDSPSDDPSDDPSDHPDSPAGPNQPGAGLAFGLDMDSLALQHAAGLRPDYATIWIGPWNLQHGWLVPDAHFATLRAANITPAIHFFYWGDDLAPRCLVDGCNGKTRQGWDRLGDQLVEHLHAQMQGDPVLIVLETEFNKGSVARHEPLDALLAEKANALRDGYPAARIVLGFGGWNPQAWETWDRAAQASDAIGLQALAGSASAEGPAGSLFNTTLEGAIRLRELFGKPVVIDDLAVPSAPDPATPVTQYEALVPFLAGAAQLQEAGVEAILYRSFTDNPGVPLTHYYGEAERHFGLAEAGTGALKPAGEAWAHAIRFERVEEEEEEEVGPTESGGPEGPAEPAGPSAPVDVRRAPALKST